MENENYEKNNTTYACLPIYLLGKEYADDIPGNRFRLFLKEAKGDGMRLAGIRNGDKLIVDTTIEPIDGDVVIATVDGQEMCRRYFHMDGRTCFRREDGFTPDTTTEEFIIHGVVVGVMGMHRYSDLEFDPNNRLTAVNKTAREPHLHGKIAASAR